MAEYETGIYNSYAMVSASGVVFMVMVSGSRDGGDGGLSRQ